MKFLSPLLFIFLLASCAERSNTSSMDDTSTAPTTDEMESQMPDRQSDMSNSDMDMSAPSPQLQQTVQAVESAGGDITALQPSTAVSNIDGWISQLEGMDGTSSIVTDLKSLKTELTAGTIDGAKVSTLLSSLSDKTEAMSDKAPGLSTLASVLQAGSDKLAGK